MAGVTPCNVQGVDCIGVGCVERTSTDVEEAAMTTLTLQKVFSGVEVSSILPKATSSPCSSNSFLLRFFQLQFGYIAVDS